jgi:osmotically-inducible protein OsmY
MGTFAAIALAAAVTLDQPIEFAAPPTDDATVQARIETALLLDEDLSPFPIDVEVRNGVAILTGAVDTQDQQVAAIELAEEQWGVRRVDNRLVYGEGGPDTSAPSPARNHVRDWALATAVRERLRHHKRFARRSLDVSVNGGVVRLTGAVDSEAEARAIVELVRGLRGVKSAEDGLRVMPGEADALPKGPELPANQRLAEQVYDAIKLDAAARIAGLTVRVNRGYVLLEGEAPDSAQRMKAAALAASVIGVGEVHNRIAPIPGVDSAKP